MREQIIGNRKGVRRPRMREQITGKGCVGHNEGANHRKGVPVPVCHA